ncbi:fused signal recognition particle receptor [Marchantia polymorpha subsp. ruderalis]|uniref:SRP54-type proteins GTP-binding domain-containing protein n=2 Tax=Marchantia polymorpha TaxID=3197 RepID=A0A176VQK1_MARPO|nr:hypothetical protein AXG93_2675s1060 [Marchantia polymorpha subsp. ruderalis]PTQ32580.1 hypothetical protein MARPO_0097s0055 [Marchantia polymorpha]BBN13731.1 hypothetical protein Mp_6g05880 [Marchantia polymorpha subsp. ruderalis]|eukprot:PTQ32580.1 hypothetical protein MARPO_0097s0055 [Marchantia polymorpha]
MAASISCVLQGWPSSRAVSGSAAHQSLAGVPVVVSFPSKGSAAVERAAGIRCEAGSGEKVGFFGRLGRVIKEKAKGDIDRLFNGFSKTRENLSVVDELLTYWNLSDSETVLDELEEALLVADFGPRTASKIVDELRTDILKGKLKTGPEIKAALKANILNLLTQKVTTTELQLGTSRPAVIMIVGVNGGGKTTTIGKLAHRFKKMEDTKVLMAAGDTFRAAASEQLDVWAERTGSDIEVGEGEKKRPAAVLAQATRRAVEEGYDILLADTSGRLHTNFNLMEELRNCRRSITKVLPGAPHEVLMVLDGTTGLNMLPQARQFNQVAGVTGFIVTKLDGTSRGGCVVSVVDELAIPVKFIGIGEKLDDLQAFDPEAFVNALFP